MALNYLALGQPRWCPPVARAGRPLTALQGSMCLRLRRLVASFCGPGSLPTEPPVKIAKMFDLVADAQASAIGTSLASRYAAFAAPVTADRALYRKTDAKFNIANFLALFSRAAFEDPSFVERKALPRWARAGPLPRVAGGGAQSWSAADDQDDPNQDDDCFDDVLADVLYDAGARPHPPAGV